MRSVEEAEECSHRAARAFRHGTQKVRGNPGRADKDLYPELTWESEVLYQPTIEKIKD